MIMEKTIKLELHQSTYDWVKEEVKKEYKRYHFTNMVFPVMLVIFLWISYIFPHITNKYDRWALQCDYMLTTDTWTTYIKTNSNPTTGEIINIIGNQKVLFLKQMTCDGERD